jgi:stress response protein YsnF
MTAFTEDAEEVIELEGANAGDFELEQRGLARIRIDGVDTLWRQQRVIENVAAGARNDEQHVFRSEVERLSIDRRIFPAGVVDEGARVKSPKQTLIEPIGQCRCFLQRSVCHGHEFMNGTERW